jgi:hypothetical protein
MTLRREPPTRLYYDPGCGPCRLFARSVEWAAHARLHSLPYDGVEADRELAGLPTEVRFAYAHLVDGRARYTGADIMAPLVGLTFGPTGERVVRDVGPADRALRWLYDRFWTYRRTRGCAAPQSSPAA